MPSYDEWTEAQDWETVAVDDHELHVAYYEEGEDQGDPVVFLHGIPTCSFLWRDIVPAIAEQRRVIVPDMVGYGESAMQDGFDRSIRAQEEMIDGLLGELGIDSAAFVGHDLGGGVGLRLAVHQPDVIDRLVLSNAVAYDSWPVEPVLDLGLPETAQRSVGELQELLDGMLRNTLADPDHSEEFIDGIKAQWDSTEGVTSLCRNAIATNTNHTTEIDPAEIESETLCLWGEDDDFQSIEYARRLVDDIDEAELVGIESASHWVPEDRPEEYRNRLQAFLLDGYDVSEERT